MFNTHLALRFKKINDSWFVGEFFPANLNDRDLEDALVGELAALTFKTEQNPLVADSDGLAFLVKAESGDLKDLSEAAKLYIYLIKRLYERSK